MRGWRTIAFNVALVLFALTDYLTVASGTFSAIFEDPRHAALAVTVIGLVNVLLRLVTTTPAGKRKPRDTNPK